MPELIIRLHLNSQDVSTTAEPIQEVMAEHQIAALAAAPDHETQLKIRIHQ